ncbi:hypothetical protein NZ698_09425 [Chryseobacterium sp. PBS4-4]|uniref:Bacteriocin n=1 Tax=Chryseobacterium edaphi TaxID=2976532 RepID=A0ABT2W5F8_9FLAO|nr:hypothetical protein [Chryseobacterium edaphi]MCU7617418.1 hypothetical protein [Chryseobacterium edaphi]
MKNLKKISRRELKNLVGGKKNLGIEEGLGDGEAVEKTYQCCLTLYNCGSCSIGSNCPSGYFLRSCF